MGSRFTYTWSGAGEEDQAAQVGGALVAERAGGIDEGADAIRLDGGADERGTPGRGGSGRLTGLEHLFGAVGGLGALVGLLEQRGQDGDAGDLVEGDADGDGGGLDGGEVCEGKID